MTTEELRAAYIEGLDELPTPTPEWLEIEHELKQRAFDGDRPPLFDWDDLSVQTESFLPRSFMIKYVGPASTPTQKHADAWMSDGWVKILMSKRKEQHEQA